MNNRSKRMHLTVWLFLLIFFTFPIEDAFIARFFGYMCYALISIFVAWSIFKREDDDDEPTGTPKE